LRSSNLYSNLKQLSLQRSSWLLLATTALAIELCALYFQHVMNLEPCVMCIYERIPMLAIIAAGLIGASAPQSILIRLIGFMTWSVASIWGLLLAMEHVDFQMNPSPFARCEFFPNFPDWLPLHEMIPWFFNPTGDCADIVWQFLGYSMPQWLILIFSLYAITSIIVAIFAVLPSKKSNT